MIAIGEDLVLQRQERAAGIHQIYARQVILLGDFLRAQMLLDRHRVVRAAFDGRVVGHDDAVPAFDDADARDDAGRGTGVVVHAVRRQRRELQEIRSRIDQEIDALARRELVSLAMFGGRLRAAALANGGQALAQFRGEALHARFVPSETFAVRIEVRLDQTHRSRVSAMAAPVPVPS